MCSIHRSQSQLSKMLSVIVESDTLKSAGGPQSRTARLGPEGQKVLENLRAVINATKQWGDAKNGDDLLQNFLVRRTSSSRYLLTLDPVQRRNRRCQRRCERRQPAISARDVGGRPARN